MEGLVLGVFGVALEVVEDFPFLGNVGGPPSFGPQRGATDSGGGGHGVGDEGVGMVEPRVKVIV
jgi:hypothetical protein